MICNGFQTGSFYLLKHPKWSKVIFGIFFDPFFVIKQPIFKAFWDFRSAKTSHHELKPCPKNLFCDYVWS